MDYETAPLKDLVARYNELAASLGETSVNRFSDRKAALRRLRALEAQVEDQTVEELEELIRYPLQPNHWHAMNPAAKKRAKREVIELVAKLLFTKREADVEVDEETGERWAFVYLDNAKIDGMDAKIWAGHLSQLSKERRYKKVKGHKGAFGLVLIG